MKNEIQIKALTLNDLASMIKLFNRTRGKNDSESTFRKKYDQSDLNITLIGTGAFLGNKLVGMCPLTYYQFEDRNTKFIL